MITLLSASKTGLSGVEISAQLGINRVTMTKFLNVFAAEGIIKQKNIGNLNLWLVEEGTEQYQFPDDYFKVQEKYIEFLNTASESAIYNLIRNCIVSKVDVIKLMTEVIIPSIIQGTLYNAFNNRLDSVLYDLIYKDYKQYYIMYHTMHCLIH